MHISRIYVENFGRFNKKEVHLEDGVVIVRAANEAGKSTLFILAPMYAFFGSSSLDVTLPDMVRLGEKKMYVEVTYGPYKVKRNQTSASVVGNGVEISGQDEVSSFFYSLFGISKGAENYVLVSRQGETAGIISKKPGEVLSFIESVAGFKQVDTLFDKVKLKFPSGSRTTLESLIVTQEDECNTRKEAHSYAVSNYVPEFYINTIACLKAKIAAQSETLTSCKSTIMRIVGEMDKASKHNGTVDTAIEHQKHLTTTLGKAKDTLTELKSKKFSFVPDEDLKAAEELLASSDEKVALRNLYEKVITYTVPNMEWEGDLKSFYVEVKKYKDVIKDLEKSIREQENRILVARSNTVSETVCPTCGSDITEKYIRINSELEMTITSADASLKSFLKLLEEAKVVYKDLMSVESVHNSRGRISNHPSISVDENFVPSRVTWVKDEPAIVDHKAIKDASALISNNKAVKADQLRNTEAIVKCESLIKDLGDSLSAVVIGEKIDITEMHNEIKTLSATKDGCEDFISSLSKQVSANEEEERSKLRVISNSVASLQEANDKLAELKKLLLTDDRNSKLIKAVKDAKGVVLNSVWDKVLNYTAATFSAIRGTEGDIEKTAKGFRVGNIPVQGLSGSAKSVFGIALRNALRDIFAPTCGFIIFDEPFSDMDETRTLATVGAIQTINGQVIVITHESNSELSADQVIEL